MVPDVLFKTERDHSQASECPSTGTASLEFQLQRLGFRLQGLNHQMYGLGNLYKSPGMLARDNQDASQVHIRCWGCLSVARLATAIARDRGAMGALSPKARSLF